MRQIFAAIKIPSIYYIKHGRHLIKCLPQTGADIVSVCHEFDLSDKAVIWNVPRLQGNFFNGLLFAKDDVIKKEVHNILRQAKAYQRFIFNLSHGVLPNTDLNKLKLIVDEIHTQRS